MTLPLSPPTRESLCTKDRSNVCSVSMICLKNEMLPTSYSTFYIKVSIIVDETRVGEATADNFINFFTTAESHREKRMQYETLRVRKQGYNLIPIGLLKLVHFL